MYKRQEEDFALFIEELMNRYELNAKVIKRRNKYVIYMKSAERIGDFLRAIGASQSVMDFEMTRIDRSMANTVNRWNNCDIANEVKAMSASTAQIEDIAYVIDKAGIEILDDKTRIVALLRLENPESVSYTHLVVWVKIKELLRLPVNFVKKVFIQLRLQGEWKVL